MDLGFPPAFMASKIHFISHFEKSYEAVNIGDWICSPYAYFSDFFSQYTCVFHSHWNILWHEIERGDVVILGGGGQLDNSDELNEQINRILRNCDNVVIWGSGTHKYAPSNIFGMKTAEVPIEFRKARLIGIRDYNHPSGLPYLPCASCMHPAFKNIASRQFNIQRRIGTIRSALEASFAVSGTPTSIDNSQPLEKILGYISESEVILVSSYHGAFWSQLLGRKVILPETRLCVDKYKFFRYRPSFLHDSSYNETILIDLANGAQEPVGFLEESQELSIQFFNKVKSLIQDVLVKPEASELQTIAILAKRNAQLEFSLREAWGFVKGVNHRLSVIEKAIEERGISSM